MKTQLTLMQLASELERQQASKKDVVVPSTALQHATTGGLTEVTVPEPTGSVRYPLTPLARRQLADKLHIPFSYFERMREHAPDLLDGNVNRWLQQDADRRMLRILDGQVRAVLSDRYRRLDNFALAEAILPVLQALPGIRFESVALTDTRMYIKCVTSRVQGEVQPGDVVQAGLVISNSEVGEGMLSVQPLLFRLVCRNGLISGAHALRKTHVGRQSPMDELHHAAYREDTLVAEDKAFFLKVRDVVQAAVSQIGFHDSLQRLQKTLGLRLKSGPEQSVEILAQRYGLSDTERTGVLQELVLAGDLSAFGMINAVTQFSQDLDNYDRATEFETLGGRLLALRAHEWSTLGMSA